LEWIFEEYLPTTKMLRRVMAGFDNLKNRTEQREELRNILTQQLNEQGDLRGRPKDKEHLLAYIAEQHDVEPKTIDNWIGIGHRDAKLFAQDPDRMAKTFDLDRPTMLGLSEEELESVARGYSVTLSNGETLAIDTNAVYDVSDLSDQNN
jgi:hypothetical protein